MHAADAGLEVRAPVTAGVHVGERVVRRQPVGAGRRHAAAAGGFRPRLRRAVRRLCRRRRADDSRPVSAPAVPATRRAAARCSHARPARRRGRIVRCATQILTTLARRAYRRPATGRRDRDAARRSIDTGPQAAAGSKPASSRRIERMLVSFNFLFRIESDPPARAPRAPSYRLSDLDLASRLSFFLWSSIPDEELLTLASARTAAASRPCSSSRSAACCAIRARARWWTTSPVSGSACARRQTFQPDPNIFPEFDENLRDAFLQETSLFLDSQLRADRSIVDLVTADYSFVNERLAQHYGVPGVYGERFRRVTFTDGVARRPARPGRHADGDVVPGSHGAGAARLLGARKPARHAAAAAAARRAGPRRPTSADGRQLSMREQMEVHRRIRRARSVTCAWIRSGSALENFDADRPVAHDERRPAGRCVGGVRRRHADRRRARGCARFVLDASRQLRPDVRREAADLCAGPAGGLSRPAGHPQDRARGRRAGLSLVGHHSGSSSIVRMTRRRSTMRTRSRAHDASPRRRLSRRTVLRGTGRHRAAAVARCDGAGDDRARADGRASRALRFGAVYVPNGVIPGQWFPTAEGAGFEFTPTLQAARAVSRSPAGGERARQRAAAAAGRASVQQPRRRQHALSDRRHAEPQRCAPASRSIRLRRRRSGQDTALPSLELALESVDSGTSCDFGRSCVYTGTIAWAGPTSPLPMEHDPERRVRAPVRRQRHHRCRRAARAACSRRAAFSIRCSARSRACAAGSPRPTARRSRATSKACATSSGAFRTRRCAQRRGAGRSIARPAVPETFEQHARLMFDLQLLAYPGRRDARRHVHDRPRIQRPHLSGDRRARCASSDLASPARSGAHGEVREDQPLPRVAVRRSSSRR